MTTTYAPPSGAGLSLENGPVLLGDSSSVAVLKEEIEMSSRTDAKVLIVGETGVGKEVVARLVHQSGARRRHSFVAINCAGLPDSLLESELFGHARGSFTGAYRDKPGLATVADRGTLFLDEVGEMSPRMQGVLLRFLETGEIHRLGSDTVEKRVDVRVIAATNRNLVDRISSGDFREDLYYRLNVICIVVPPLRERGRDILLLFNHYLAHYCHAHRLDMPLVQPVVEELLLGHAWPGNVRELKNVAERVAINHRDGVIGTEILPAEIRGTVIASKSVQASSAATQAPHVCRPEIDFAWEEMIVSGRSFWQVVHPLFMDRELTKSDVREIIRRGLYLTQGSYRKLMELFHIPGPDYKRFLAFLYQHNCHLAFHEFRESRQDPVLRSGRAS
jgi:transcriptional regulator with PAS, ATPase and Fis domain